MITIRTQYGKTIPGELALQLWAETGSLQKASGQLAQQGYTNPGGRPYSSQIVYRYAMLWACWNPEKARNFFSDTSDAEWEAYLTKSAANFMTRATLLKWLDQFPQFKKYGHLYAKKLSA